MNNILLVEDENNVATTLKERFTEDGFNCHLVQSISEAKQILNKNNYNLALLDVGLPDGSGFELAQHIRKKDPLTAIIFLTALQSPEERIHGLELGAEDYITKPFHYKELLLRINNVLKRTILISQSSSLEASGVQIGEAKVYFKKFQIVRDENLTPLTHKECALLKLLYDHSERALSRDEILNTIWSENEYPTPRTIDNFILRLRKFIEIDYHKPKIIVSIHGFGYQLKL